MVTKAKFDANATRSTAKSHNLGIVQIAADNEVTEYGAGDGSSVGISGDLVAVFIRATDANIGMYLAVSAAAARDIAAGILRCADRAEATAPARAVIQ